MQEEQNEFRKYIKNLNDEFQEVAGGGFYALSTGEFLTKTEVQKYIQKKVEEYNVNTLATRNSILKSESNIETGQRLINKKSSKPKNTKLKLKDLYDGGDFNIVYRNRIEEVNNMKMTNNEKLTYYGLRDFIQYPTNCIVIKGEIPTMKQLEPIIGLNEKTIRNSLKSLQEKGLLKLIQYGHRKSIYINPEYYASGKNLDVKILQMFGLVACDDEKVNNYVKNNGYKD